MRAVWEDEGAGEILVRGLVSSVCSDCVACAAQILGDKLGNPNVPFRSRSYSIEIVDGNRAAEPPVVVELHPEVADIFRDSDAVNAVLRPIANLIAAESARLSAESLPNE